jgi:SAM-dependent methyltransferase
MRLDRLRRWLLRHWFGPGPVGLLFNPFYLARRGLARHMRELAPRLGGRVLDIGCGRRPYESLFDVRQYVGLDIDSPASRQLAAADCLYDGRRMPFPDATFDGALAIEVLEHVFAPEPFLGEIARVLRPGGCLLLAVPFVWDEHEQPLDYARYASFGLRHLLQRQGFEILEHRKSVADLRVVFQVLNCYLHKTLFTGRPLLDLGLALVFTAPVNLMALACGAVAPANADLFLDNVVLARRPSAVPAEGGDPGSPPGTAR